MKTLFTILATVMMAGTMFAAGNPSEAPAVINSGAESGLSFKIQENGISIEPKSECEFYVYYVGNANNISKSYVEYMINEVAAAAHGLDQLENMMDLGLVSMGNDKLSFEKLNAVAPGNYRIAGMTLTWDYDLHKVIVDNYSEMQFTR